MKLRYQIKRTKRENDYLFELIDTETKIVLYISTTRSPIAPKALRDAQAKRNSRHHLDSWGIR